MKHDPHSRIRLQAPPSAAISFARGYPAVLPAPKLNLQKTKSALCCTSCPYLSLAPTSILCGKQYPQASEPALLLAGGGYCGGPVVRVVALHASLRPIHSVNPNCIHAFSPNPANRQHSRCQQICCDPATISSALISRLPPSSVCVPPFAPPAHLRPSLPLLHLLPPHRLPPERIFRFFHFCP